MSDPNFPLQANMLAHGGRLNEARRLFPDAPQPFIDLSTGINPVAYPLPNLSAEVFSRLPEPEALEGLQVAAASAYGAASASMIVAAPGTQILIDLLPRLFSCDEVAIWGPTYAEHGAAWRRSGAVVKDMTTWDEVQKARNVVLCNPNNPDGRRTAGEALARLADQLALRGGMLIVDEAFVDFEEATLSVVGFLPRPNLIVLRSFGKSYGLAGLRLGFAIAAPYVAEQIRTALGPWAVSGPAIEIGARALADQTWSKSATARLESEAVRLDASLVRAGMKVVGGTKLYRLSEISMAANIFETLGKAGILVRRFSDHPNLLRFGFPADETQWVRLEEALL